MKKTYCKPCLLFEDFRLMDSISRICSVQAVGNMTDRSSCTSTAQDEATCAAYDGAFGLFLFLSGNANCQSVNSYEHPNWSYFGSM